jgi:hypothetical protein
MLPPIHRSRSCGALAAALACGLLAGCSGDGAPDATAPDELAGRRGAARTAHAAVSVFAGGFDNPRGLRWGPDGNLYVAEAGTSDADMSTEGQCEQVAPPIGPYRAGFTARVSRVSPAGERSTVADGLPSSVNAIGDVVGAADVEFIAGRLYALIGGAGCSRGHADHPNGVLRVHHDGSATLVADLSAFYQANPVAQPTPFDFEPDGTPYDMVSVGHRLWVVEANGGALDRVETDGGIERIVDLSATYGHLVPTAVDNRGLHFFIGTLGLFPIEPGSQRIIEVRADGSTRTLVEGLTAVLGIALGRRGDYYVLETSTAPGFPTPGTGRILHLDRRGSLTTIVEGLTFPTAMTLGPDGDLYVSHKGFGFGPGEGEVLRVDVE